MRNLSMGKYLLHIAQLYLLSEKREPCPLQRHILVIVTRACWRVSEWGSARKSLNPRARRSVGIGPEGVALIRVKGLRTVISPHASENVVRVHVRMTLDVGDLVFAGAVQRLIVCSDAGHASCTPCNVPPCV
ncbi:jg4929 [Pararge aegeria aegeria]|uniref:Jg4929 protein n=1 Tax=Pararge aegeria aegeria TaxID=348720 RepID=A0A8S4SKZ1_9NEOP|nr:jg4929 [Pararge aegeria aegeria]